MNFCLQKVDAETWTEATGGGSCCSGSNVVVLFLRRGRGRPRGSELQPSSPETQKKKNTDSEKRRGDRKLYFLTQKKTSPFFRPQFFINIKSFSHYQLQISRDDRA